MVFTFLINFYKWSDIHSLKEEIQYVDNLFIKKLIKAFYRKIEIK